MSEFGPLDPFSLVRGGESTVGAAETFASVEFGADRAQTFGSDDAPNFTREVGIIIGGIEGIDLLQLV